MKSKRPILLMLLAVLVVAMVALPATAQAKRTFDQTLDKLFKNHYPQHLESYFTALGTNADLGFRWAGTSAERAVSAKVLKEYKAMGLAGARREKVPCDVFEFESAGLTFNNQTVVASTFGGVPGTPPEGVTGRLVYVGGGTAADYAAVGDVTGKLVQELDGQDPRRAQHRAHGHEGPAVQHEVHARAEAVLRQACGR